MLTHMFLSLSPNMLKERSKIVALQEFPQLQSLSFRNHEISFFHLRRIGCVSPIMVRSFKKNCDSILLELNALQSVIGSFFSQSVSVFQLLIIKKKEKREMGTILSKTASYQISVSESVIIFENANSQFPLKILGLDM